MHTSIQHYRSQSYVDPSRAPRAPVGFFRQPLKRCTAVRASSTSNSSPNLDEVGKVAKEKLKEVGTNLQDTAARTWRKLEAEYQISDKAERARVKLEEQARDVDQKWNVRRRVRNSIDHVQRMWPVWSAQLDSFASTWYGKTTVLVVLLVIISSPLFWRALNLLLIVWWLAVPIAAALVSSAQRKAAERAQAEAEERARRQNPFADMFRQARSTATGGTKPGRSYVVEREGPVIDADFIVIKDENSKK